MADLSGFDATQVDPATEYSPIPPGDYIMQIIASGMEPTSNGKGRFLKLELEVVDGEQAGRKAFDRLNLENPNTTAVDIARRTLSAICHAVGVMQPRDSEQLHFKNMLVSIAVEPRNDKPGQFSNQIKAYKKAGDQASGGGQQQSGATKSGFTPGAATGGASGGGAPWKRNG